MVAGHCVLAVQAIEGPTLSFFASHSRGGHGRLRCPSCWLATHARATPPKAHACCLRSRALLLHHLLSGPLCCQLACGLAATSGPNSSPAGTCPPNSSPSCGLGLRGIACFSMWLCRWQKGRGRARGRASCKGRGLGGRGRGRGPGGRGRGRGRGSRPCPAPPTPPWPGPPRRRRPGPPGPGSA